MVILGFVVNPLPLGTATVVASRSLAYTCLRRYKVGVMAGVVGRVSRLVVRLRCNLSLPRLGAIGPRERVIRNMLFEYLMEASLFMIERNELQTG